METLLIILIVAAAAAYLIKTFVKGASGSGDCARGGCANCPPSKDCADNADNKG
ncbi:MAG: FeoB-associated Cys-rich membrane protein [Pseudomonadota bacterium]